MKHQKSINIFLLLFLLSSIAFAQDFKPGNLILLRHNIGGSGGDKDPMNNGKAGMPIFLDEYDFSNPDEPKLVQSFQLPSKRTKNSGSIVLSGLNGLESYMTRSVNKQYLVIPGYGVDEGQNVHRQPSKLVPRTVALVDARKNVDLSTNIKNAFSGISYRGVASTDGTEIWSSGETVAGYSSGPYYAKKGAERALNIGAALPGSRSIRVFDNKLYVSLKTGVKQIGNFIPRTNDTLATITLATPQPKDNPDQAYDFFITDVKKADGSTDKVMYIMDYTFGVRKYSLYGTYWLPFGYVELPHARAVEGKIDTKGNVSLYIVTQTDNPLRGDSKVYLLTDNAGAMKPIDGKPKMLLNTADTFRQFRSIAFSPEK